MRQGLAGYFYLIVEVQPLDSPEVPSMTRPLFGNRMVDCCWEGLLTAIGKPSATTEELIPRTPFQDNAPGGRTTSNAYAGWEAD